MPLSLRIISAQTLSDSFRLPGPTKNLREVVRDVIGIASLSDVSNIVSSNSYHQIVSSQMHSVSRLSSEASSPALTAVPCRRALQPCPAAVSYSRAHECRPWPCGLAALGCLAHFTAAAPGCPSKSGLPFPPTGYNTSRRRS